MKYETRIKKISGIVITCLFLLAITPKQYIHFLFAKHNDSTEKINRDHGTILSLGGYNCNVDQLVAEPNFDIPPSVLPFRIHYFSSGTSFYKSSLYFTLINDLKDRGPPMEL